MTDPIGRAPAPVILPAAAEAPPAPPAPPSRPAVAGAPGAAMSRMNQGGRRLAGRLQRGMNELLHAPGRMLARADRAIENTVMGAVRSLDNVLLDEAYRRMSRYPAFAAAYESLDAYHQLLHGGGVYGHPPPPYGAPGAPPPQPGAAPPFPVPVHEGDEPPAYGSPMDMFNARMTRIAHRRWPGYEPLGLERLNAMGERVAELEGKETRTPQEETELALLNTQVASLAQAMISMAQIVAQLSKAGLDAAAKAV